MSTNPRDVARRWLAAFNAGDVEAVVDLYGEDAWFLARSPVYHFD